ncbi:MAG: hypothetical protein DMG06_20405 [Acidobacteria bacterium]|nr:MAG: hypothetical protein DMG06_20405 [Acidobacteriota bacterium]
MEKHVKVARGVAADLGKEYVRNQFRIGFQRSRYRQGGFVALVGPAPKHPQQLNLMRKWFHHNSDRSWAQYIGL